MLDRSDQWHGQVVELWQELIDRCVTTEAVVTEACYMTGRSGDAARPLEFLLAASIPVVALPLEAYRRCALLMHRYVDLPMDFADATLVALSDVLETRSVFTTDRRGFGTYRGSHGQVFDMWEVG